jgi:hypothetical protein
MAYYIFLKSLRSLEEFRKNPHVKIPPKSPSINFQSLGKFKNPIFIRKRIFPSLSAQSAQRPAGSPGLSAQPATVPSPFLPAATRTCSAHPGLRGISVLAKIRLLFTFAQPGDDVFSLCHRQAGPTCQFHLPPCVGRPRPRRRFSRPPRATPPLPRDAESRTLPALIPRVNPLLNHPPRLRRSPSPYINFQGPPATPTPPPLALKLSLALLRSRAILASLPRLRCRCAASSPSSGLG